MKAIKLLTASALLAGLAALSFAGPSPQFWSQQTTNPPAQPAKATTQPDRSIASANPVMTCDGCKTTELRDLRQVGGPKSTIVTGIVVGAKHTCTHCGGEVKVVNSKLTNSMPKACPMCGPEAANCIATVSPAKKA